MPEVTVVAKRFTLVQAAQAAKSRSFILLEGFCLMLHPALNDCGSMVWPSCAAGRILQEIEEGNILVACFEGAANETNTSNTTAGVAAYRQFHRSNFQSFLHFQFF